MAALSTSTYGKATAMSAVTDFADGVTAALEKGHAAIDELDAATRTGGPVPQGAVNTLRRVVQDLGELTTSARRSAADDDAQRRQDEAARRQQDDAAGQGTATTGTQDADQQKAAAQQKDAGGKDGPGKGPAPAKP
jgi:C4-type Zn-finger protein